MNKIELEINRLLALAAGGELPGYPAADDAASCFAPACAEGLTEYFSGENDALEGQLKVLWQAEPRLQACIPLILAAVEKSRGQAAHSVKHTELYNYTM